MSLGFKLILCTVVSAAAIAILDGPGIISSTKHSYKILEGYNLLVICTVTNSPDLDVFWTKNDTKSTFFQAGKRLEILNIRRSYSGDYICHALNTTYPEHNETGVNVTVEAINVDVQYPAEIDSFSLHPYAVMENGTFNVSCNMQANPNPTWSIRNRDTGQELVEATMATGAWIGTIKATCDHAGYWECTGYNALSKRVNVTRGHTLTVYCPPKPQFGKNNYSVSAIWVGQTVELVMELRSFPPASYTWSRDDGQAISDYVNQSDSLNTTVLRFDGVEPRDFGGYTLKMQNKYGTHYANYQLIADGIPQRATHLQYSEVTHDSVKLEWISGFDMGYQQIFQVMELYNGNAFKSVSGKIYASAINHGIGQHWTYILTGLTNNTFYNLSVEATNDSPMSNHYTSGVAMPPVTFWTTDKNSSTKHPYKILEGDNLLVICNITDSSDLDVFWTKNDTKSTFFQAGKRLEILHIKRSFSGDYICHALSTTYPDHNETGINVTVEAINVDVQYPAEIDSFSLNPLTVMQNDTFKISCNMQANPNPTWSIRNRDTGQELLRATGHAAVVLGPIEVTCDNAGYYECTGYNALSKGVNVTRGQYLTEYCPPKPQYGKNNYSVSAIWVGQTVELVMELRSFPQASYTWSRDDGKDISDYVNQLDTLNTTMLRFDGVEPRDFGRYTLKMQNKYGVNYAHYQLIADGIPQRATHLQYSEVTHDSVKLEWISGFDMGYQQIFQVMELFNGNAFKSISGQFYTPAINHGIGQHWTFIQTGLTSNTFYNLSVEATNGSPRSKHYTSGLAMPSVTFWTTEKPHDTSNLSLKVGIPLGTLGAIAVLAFIVYMIKYRRYKTSYKSVYVVLRVGEHPSTRRKPTSPISQPPYYLDTMLEHSYVGEM